MEPREFLREFGTNPREESPELGGAPFHSGAGQVPEIGRSGLIHLFRKGIDRSYSDQGRMGTHWVFPGYDKYIDHASVSRI